MISKNLIIISSDLRIFKNSNQISFYQRFKRLKTQMLGNYFYLKDFYEFNDFLPNTTYLWIFF